MANHHTKLNTNVKKTQGVADKRSKKRKRPVLGEASKSRAGFGKTKAGLKKRKKEGFGMGFLYNWGGTRYKV